METPRRAMTFIVRLIESDAGRLSGVAERARTGEKVRVDGVGATLAPGNTQQFTAQFGGVEIPVIWSVSGAVATITPQGLFTAFTSPSSGPVTVVVTEHS